MKKELFQRLKSLLNPSADGVNQDTVNQYNQTIEQLETDYQGQIATLEAEHQKQLSTLQEQVATLQDQLKARPTKVEGTDPQVKVGPSEETFGKQLLKEMPAHFKDKFKKPVQS